MQKNSLRNILLQIKDQKLSVQSALKQLRAFPFEEIRNAKIDTHRAIRCGFPEVVFCEGKTPASVTLIMGKLIQSGETVLATRARPQHFKAVKKKYKKAKYHEISRTITLLKKNRPKLKSGILILTAGTSDIPVAEEARVTADCLGHRADTVYDAGVAGIHRLLAFFMFFTLTCQHT